MAVSLPRLLRRLRPELSHFQHALPLGLRGPSVVTIHDLHFEHDPTVMGLVDRLTFKAVVPRAVRKADHVLAVSERTKRDVVALYGIAAGQGDGHAARRRSRLRARATARTTATCCSSARCRRARTRLPRCGGRRGRAAARRRRAGEGPELAA